MCGVAGQVEELLVGPEHDLDLFNRSTVPFEAVVHARANEPPTQLGHRPVERRCLADAGVAMLEGNLAKPEVLDRGERQVRVGSEDDLRRPVEEALGNGLSLRTYNFSARRDLLLNDRGVGPHAESDERPGDHRPVGIAALPANEDRMGEPYTVRDDEAHTLAPEATNELGELVSRWERRAAFEVRPEAIRVAGQGRAERFENDPCCSGGGREPDGDDRVLAKIDDPVHAVRERDRAGTNDRGRRGDPRLRGFEDGGAEIHVRGVELVRLQRKRGERSSCRKTLIPKPAWFRPLRDEAIDEFRGGKTERHVCGRPAHGTPRPGGAGVRGGYVPGHDGDLGRHPSEPSISSLTSRLNSMAYSIGSSFVNTSRKPWMTRFWASFSVSPRLIR